MNLWDLLKSLLSKVEAMIFPPVSNCTENDIPSASAFLSNLEGHQRVLLLIGLVFTLIVFFLGFLQWYHVFMYISNEKRQNKLYFLVSLFPVSCTICLIAMVCPRTASILSSVGLLYFLLCLYVLVAFCRHLFKGRDAFSLALEGASQKIAFNNPPLCCCMPFLPKARPTERNLRRLELLVWQAPVVRACVVVANIVIVAERRDKAYMILHWTELGSVFSLLAAIFGLHGLARLAGPQLRPYGFEPIFRLLDLSLLFYTAQQPMIFDNLLRFGWFDCGAVLASPLRAKFICNFVIIVEMLFLALFATFYLSPTRNELFDKYHSSSTSSAAPFAGSIRTEEEEDEP